MTFFSLSFFFTTSPHVIFVAFLVGVALWGTHIQPSSELESAISFSFSSELVVGLPPNTEPRISQNDCHTFYSSPKFLSHLRFLQFAAQGRSGRGKTVHYIHTRQKQTRGAEEVLFSAGKMERPR
jgi:hypothetical protein